RPLSTPVCESGCHRFHPPDRGVCASGVCLWPSPRTRNLRWFCRRTKRGPVCIGILRRRGVCAGVVAQFPSLEPALKVAVRVAAMCSWVAAVAVFPEWPLVVAANRDERLDRAASGPRLWPGSPPFIAPVDEVAGGTWLGLNWFGLFVGVTNRFGVGRDDKRES